MTATTFPSGQAVMMQSLAEDRQLILGRYRPIEEAGSGGFGTVQVAWDTRIQRKVAIKCIELDEIEVARAADEEGGRRADGGAAAGAPGAGAAVAGTGTPVDFGMVEADAYELPWDQDSYVRPAEAPGYDGGFGGYVDGSGYYGGDGGDCGDYSDYGRDYSDGDHAFADDTVAVGGSGWDADAGAGAGASAGAGAGRARRAKGRDQVGYAGGAGGVGYAGGNFGGAPATLVMPQTSVGSGSGSAAGVAGSANNAGDAVDGEGAGDDGPFGHSLAHVPGLDEARTAAKLSDQSIVTVYDFEIQGTTAYLIMEYVEGITLTQLMRRFDDQIDLDIIAAVFDSVAHALDVAHNNQVLHLDIKPDNILINQQGQVKVTDFGLATLMDASGHGRAGGGTIGYMPPEQMRQEPLDARCDEWALASVTYQMLVGKNPFLAPTLSEAEAAIEDADLLLPSQCWDDLESAADDVIFYALDPDREERYDTVAEFAEELEPLLGDAEQGVVKLAALVGDAELEDEEEARQERRRRERGPHVPLRDRISSGARTAAAHALGAGGSAAVMALAASNIPVTSGLQNPAFWVLILAAGVLGVFWPHFGALLSFLLLSVAVIVQGSPVLGCVMAAATVLWWYFVARHGKAAANVALVCPIAGGFGLGQIAPLSAGFSLPPAHAVITTLYCALIAAALAACGSNSLLDWNMFANASFEYAGEIEQSLLLLLQEPSFWIIVASWILAALVLALFRRRPTRPFAFFGVVLAAAVLFAGLALEGWAASGFAALTIDGEEAISTLVAIAVMLVGTWLLPRVEKTEE